MNRDVSKCANPDRKIADNKYSEEGTFWGLYSERMNTDWIAKEMYEGKVNDWKKEDQIMVG